MPRRGRLRRFIACLGRAPRPGLPALALTLVLAACAAPAADERRVGWLGQDEHRIEVTDDVFAGAEVVRVGFSDRWQTEEYALFQAGDRQLELVFAEAKKSFSVALEYQMPITTMVPTWNSNARGDLAWGPLGRFDWRLRTWFYRIYETDRPRRPCVGLQVEWDEIYEDPFNRPRRVLFGYACGLAGEVLEDEDVRALIRSIAIRRRDEDYLGRSSARRGRGSPQPSLDADGIASSAIVAARGRGGLSASGNPNFPFAFARYFSESNGGDRR